MGAFVGSDDGEEGVGEHDEGCVPMPGRPLADLVLIEADLAPKQRFYRPPGDPPPTTRLGWLTGFEPACSGGHNPARQPLRYSHHDLAYPRRVFEPPACRVWTSRSPTELHGRASPVG
jgi:hypothetical protein